jgi:hypothetical protein
MQVCNHPDDGCLWLSPSDFQGVARLVSSQGADVPGRGHGRSGRCRYLWGPAQDGQDPQAMEQSFKFTSLCQE